MKNTEDIAKQNSAMDMIRAVFEDGEAEINGNKYVFTKMVHKQRRKVFAYLTKIGKSIEGGDFSFLDSQEFESVEAVINNSVMFNDSLLSRIDGHWDKYPQDYVIFISTALHVISFPFLPANATGLK